MEQPKARGKTKLSKVVAKQSRLLWRFWSAYVPGGAFLSFASLPDDHKTSKEVTVTVDSISIFADSWAMALAVCALKATQHVLFGHVMQKRAAC